MKHHLPWAFVLSVRTASLGVPKDFFGIVNVTSVQGLKELLNFESIDDLSDAYRRWVEKLVGNGDHFRNGRWTESVAAGGEPFVRVTREMLGVKSMSGIS
jgi:hypothetical protein